MDYIAIGLQLTATGMMVVFSGLVVLFGMMSMFQLLEQRKTSPKTTKTQQPPIPDSAAITPEVLAVISAAVTETFGKQVRVKRIRYRSPQYDTGNVWSKQGRVTIMGSHHTRR